jgi:hypothetical protein
VIFIYHFDKKPLILRQTPAQRRATLALPEALISFAFGFCPPC